MPQLWQRGLFEPLDAYAAGPNGTNLADYLPGQTRTPTSTIWASRSRRPSRCPSSASTPILYYNADMLAAKGIKVPGTWDEFRAAADKLTVREGAEVKVYGFEVPVDWWFWYALLHEAGGSLASPDGKKAAFREKGAEALQFWVDLVNKDKSMKAAPWQGLQRAWEVTNTDFLNGSASR